MRTRLHAAAPGVLLYRSLDGVASPSVIDAVFECLAPWFRPLELEVELRGASGPYGTVSWDLPVRFRNHRVGLTSRVDIRPRSRLDSPEVHDLSNESSVGELVANLLSREEPHVIWHQVVVTAASVRAPTEAIPQRLTNLEGVEFAVQTEQGDVFGPLENSSMDPPVRLELLHQGHELELQLRVVWPIWSREPGKSQFSGAVGALLAAGWSVEESDPGYAPG